MLKRRQIFNKYRYSFGTQGKEVQLDLTMDKKWNQKTEEPSVFPPSFCVSNRMLISYSGAREKEEPGYLQRQAPFFWIQGYTVLMKFSMGLDYRNLPCQQ